MYRRLGIVLLAVLAGLLVVWHTTRAQTAVEVDPTSVAALVASPIQPKEIAARKEALEEQLKLLAQSNLPKEELEVPRSRLEQLLKIYTALQETLQKRASYQAQIDALPQHLRELTQQRQELESRPPRRFPRITEALRDEVEGQLQAAQAALQDLNNQTVAGEVRLTTIARELDEHVRAREQLDKALLMEQSKGTHTAEQRLASQAEILHARLLLLRAESDMLQTEREWLSRRGPLQDALLGLARAQLKVAQQDLEVIKAALSTVLQEEQSALNSTATALEQRLEQTSDPSESILLSVRLEIVEIRRSTADYREQLNRLGDKVLTQEQHIAKMQQDLDRLTALVNKYGSGEGIAQRLLVAFERIQRERLRSKEAPMKAIDKHLLTLSNQMFAVDDQLYEFPQRIETHVASLLAAPASESGQQRDAQVDYMRRLLEEQRTALREQQQVLTALVQEHTRLLTLLRETKRQLDDSYLFILTQMFWLRDAKRMNWEVGRDVMVGAISLGIRLRHTLRVMPSYIGATLADAVHLWLVAIVVCVALPGLVYRTQRRLPSRPPRRLAGGEGPAMATRLATLVLQMLRAALWPAYMALVLGLLAQTLPEDVEQAALATALVSGLQLATLVLGVALVARVILQQDGWGQHFWAMTPDLCRLLRRTIVGLCVAAILFLVPRHVLLVAPGDGDTAVGSLALVRVLFLLFQGVVLTLVSSLGRRHSRLMSVILARSHEQDGLLWRIWPFIYLLLVAGMLGIMVLDVLGYRYAAQFIWYRTLGSLSVVLTLRLLLVMLVLRLLHAVIGYLFSMGGHLRQRYPDIEAAANRYFDVTRVVCNWLLVLLAIAVILELWGVSVTWLLTSPFGSQLLRRITVVAATIALTVLVIQVSKALCDYLILPRTTAPGVTSQAGRKLRTMAPLFQTLIKVAAVFAAVMVILEQVNIATGPVLAGVGIFGLAVGFASQSLIKDVINGLFILFEDSLSVGDVVTLRGITGVVEKVTLRAVTMRDLAANVHIIPNSTLDMITNLTKEYSRYLLDIRVSLRQDVDTVIAVLRDVDEEMRRDPVFANDILEPLEVMGLQRFDDSGLIVRARIKTRPAQQWRIGREFQRRVKKAFDAHGIEIPVPHRKLYWETPRDGVQAPAELDSEAQKFSQLGD